MRACRPDLWLFLACLSVFGVLAHGYLENTDTLVSMQGARAWWLRGDPGLVTAEQSETLPADAPTWELEHLVASFITRPDAPTFGRTGANGRHYVWFPIGHQALLIPCVVLGDLFTDWWPEPEIASVALRGPYGQQFWAQWFASFLSPLCAALTVVVLLRLARVLLAAYGGGPPRERDAVGIAIVAAFCTQFSPGAVETMSNMPGTFLLTLTVLHVARYTLDPAARSRSLLWAGLTGGAGVLVRYPLALSVTILGVWALVVAVRRRRSRDIGQFVLGGLPFAVLLMGLNAWRFGSVSETGYSGSSGFGTLDPWLGLFAIFAAPGKGVLWFTPLFLLLLPAALQVRTAATAVAAALVVVTVATYCTVVYWAAGQCWGIRYMTAPLALFTVVVLAQHRPWARGAGWRWSFAAAAALGAAISLGGHITPYVGQQHLATYAGRAEYGWDLPNVDNNVNFDPRLSPVHTHWTYAWASAGGLFGNRDFDKNELADIDHAVRAVFGVGLGDPPAHWLPHLTQPAAPDREFLHWWPRWTAATVRGFPWWLVFLAAGGLGGYSTWRLVRVCRGPDTAPVAATPHE